MEKQVEMVRKFHDKFNHEMHDRLTFPTASTRKLRISLVNEEAAELENAISNNDLVKIADAIADLLYVTLGTAIAYGMNIVPIFEEVHRTNMLKSLLKNDGGKTIKPPDWEEPQILPILWKQSQLTSESNLQEYEQLELLLKDEK